MRIVLASARLPGRAGRGARAIINGVLLGLLSEHQLRRLDEHYYDRALVFRTRQWNESGLWRWEADAIDRAFAASSRIAVLACGGGRELLALRRRGLEAIGYEPHPLLRAYAARLLTSAGFPDAVHPMPRDRFPLLASRLDGVLIGWGAYSLIVPRRARIGLLQSAALASRPHAPIMLSAFGRRRHGRELRATARLANAVRALGRPDPMQAEQIRPDPIEVGDTLAPNRVHVFTAEELSGELTDAGLVLDSLREVGLADAATSYLCALAHAP